MSRVSITDLVLRGVAIALLLFTLREPFWEKVEESRQEIVLIDTSDSLDEGAANELIESARKLSSSSSVLPFSESVASVELPHSQLTDYRILKSSWAKLNSGQTDLERGLMQTISTLGGRGGGNVILISDGNQTRGDVLRDIPIVQTSGIRVWPLIPQSNQHSNVFRIAQLHAPLVAPAKKSVEIRVSLMNTTDSPQRGTLAMVHDQKEILRQAVVLKPRSEELFMAQSDPSLEGIKEITATLTPEDSSLGVSSETIYVSGEAREKILLLSGTSDDERLITEVFVGQSYQVTALSAERENRVVNLPDFSNFSAVIFNNISARQLAPNVLSKLQQYVKAGGGFVMLGGNRSFGLGGYLGTAVEEVLPVQMVPPRSEQKRLNLAVALIIDKSKSMGNDSRLEFAKEAAREVVRNLKDEDYIGVIGFDSVPFQVVKMGLLSSIREMATERIGRLFPQGGTNPFPAIAEGRRWLEGTNAGRKHMIILTDGKIPDASPTYYEMVKEMRLLGITASTVMIGAEEDFGFLRKMAEYGGGAFYQTYDANNLPKIFLQDIKVRSGEKTLQEQREFPVRLGMNHGVSTRTDAFPPLTGYVETKARSGADLELTVIAAEGANPLLASWNYGSGRVVAFTSDANGRWSSYWARWGRFARFWSDLLDAVRSKKERNIENITFDLRHAVEHGDLELDLSLFSETSEAGVSAEVVFPDGTKREVDFKSMSRGQYQSAVTGITAGTYEVHLKVGSKILTPVAFHLSGELFGEKKGLGFNHTVLEELARQSGGRINPSQEDLMRHTTRKVERNQLGHWLVLTALVVLCGGILWREGVKVPFRSW